MRNDSAKSSGPGDEGLARRPPAGAFAFCAEITSCFALFVLLVGALLYLVWGYGSEKEAGGL